MSLTKEKIEKIKACGNKVLLKYLVIIREVASLIGLFTSSMRAVKLGSLYVRHLERETKL